MIWTLPSWLGGVTKLNPSVLWWGLLVTCALGWVGMFLVRFFPKSAIRFGYFIGTILVIALLWSAALELKPTSSAAIARLCLKEDCQRVLVYYGPLALLATACVGAGRLGLRAERRRAGLCATCGYDLWRSGATICPECGRR